MKTPEEMRTYRREQRRKLRENPANRERDRETMRRFEAAHREERRARDRTRYSEKRREVVRQWRKAHPNETRAWCRAHLDARRVAQGRRRARKVGNGGSHTLADWIVLCWASGWRCAYCGRGPLDEKTATQDHKIPLVRGGSDNIENIAVSCANCNKSKNRKTDAEFTSAA